MEKSGFTKWWKGERGERKKTEDHSNNFYSLASFMYCITQKPMFDI